MRDVGVLDAHAHDHETWWTAVAGVILVGLLGYFAMEELRMPTQAHTDKPEPVEATAPTSCNPITGEGMISKKDLFFADFAKESNPVTETEIAQDLSEKEDIKLKMTRDEIERAHETYLMNAFTQAKTTTQNETKGL